jgi:hypothetical protein
MKDTLSPATDDTIQKFTDEFDRLRKLFSERSNLQVLDTVRNIEYGVVELRSWVEHLGEFYIHSYVCSLLTYLAISGRSSKGIGKPTRGRS